MSAKTAKRYTRFSDLRAGQYVRVYDRVQGQRRTEMILSTEGTIHHFETLGRELVAVDALGRELVASFSRGKSVERVK